MTSDQLKKLRAHYHSLRNLQTVFEHSQKGLILEAEGRIVEDALRRIEQDFKGILPPLDVRSHYSTKYQEWFVSGLKAILGVALGHLEIAIDEESNTPVTQHKEFAFVSDAKLRTILERDYKELQRAYIAECWKSVIILAGGQLEAILTDLLVQNEDRAKASSKAPKNKSSNTIPAIIDWGLVHLILVAVDVKLVNPGVEKLTHSVREYRDLVHPMVEVKTSLQSGPEEAKIAVEIVNMIHRELSK